jgi:hypothetical protein
MDLAFGVISPQDWGLPVASNLGDATIEALGISAKELAARARAATYEWLHGQFDEAIGAFYGFYRAPDKYQKPPQTVNLIAPWQFLAAYDRYTDPALLEMAQRAATWFYTNHVVTHPMSTVAGGVRDGVATEHVWTKFAAEEIITCLGLAARTDDTRWTERAMQSGRYIIQARRHNFAPRYDLSTGLWLPMGWDSWGRAVEACLVLWRASDDALWLDEAAHWRTHALDIQADDGAFYLIDGEYYNTDLAADELRALVMLYKVTGHQAYLNAARRFADWHLEKQMANGAWPLIIDSDGNVVMPTAGPGDIPNIGVALLRLYHVTRSQAHLDAAYRALRYSISVQAVPGSGHPYTDDEKVRWGFWSWDPYYDFTLSGDQSTHHAREMWFLLDYLASDGSL